jgi:hypothetical protein
MFQKMVRTNLKQATDKQSYFHVFVVFTDSLAHLLCLQLLLHISFFVDAKSSKNVEITRFIVIPSVQNIVF